MINKFHREGPALDATQSLLREATAVSHERVETALDLLDPALTRTRVRDILTRLHGFWAGTEPLLDAWAATSPALAADLDWPRRRRAQRLADDVAALMTGPTEPAPVAAAALGSIDDAAALGWLYVAEGSTLGGAVISRRLAPLADQLGGIPGFFVPYAEGPGPMWRDYQAVLRTWVADRPRRRDAVVAAAVATFAALEAWVAPLRIEDAA